MQRYRTRADGTAIVGMVGIQHINASIALNGASLFNAAMNGRASIDGRCFETSDAGGLLSPLLSPYSKSLIKQRIIGEGSGVFAPNPSFSKTSAGL